MYIGIDHSTTAVKVSIIDGRRPTSSFQISRTSHSDTEYQPDILSEISSRIPLDEIKLAAISYCYGDRIDKITPISNVTNRGVVDCSGMGQVTGVGTKIFDQIKDSSVPVVVVPGIHRGIGTLHPYFKHYSLLTGGDKVGSIRASYERYSQFSDGKNNTWIWAGASSSVMAGAIIDGKIRGVFHWIGPIHGWPDVEEVRSISDHGIEDIFRRSGFLGKGEYESIIQTGPEENIEMIRWALKHDISSLYPFFEEAQVEPEALVLTGRRFREGPRENNISRQIYEWGIERSPVLFTEPYASARGLAYIARDLMEGATSILGIDVAPTIEYAKP